MSALIEWMDRKFYPEYENNWDNITFRLEILKYIKKNDIILDLGAGAGIVPQMNFRNLAKKVCGIDPDQRVLSNPYLDESKVAIGETIPYADASFDVVFSNSVLEHLEKPDVVFKEVSRIMKPGGFFLVKTPNKMHYMPLIARITPHKFHQYVNRKRGRDSIDTFPTLYLVNTPKDISLHAFRSGLTVYDILLIEGRPEYLRIHPLAYFFGWVYEKIVNSYYFFRRFRIVLIAVLKKPNE